MAQQQDTPRWMVDEVDQLVTTDDYRQLSMIAESYARVAARHLADGRVESAREFAAGFVYADAGIDRMFTTRAAQGRAS